MRRIGAVHELWRFPVKSMQGEALKQLSLDLTGVAGDRRWAVNSSAAPLGKPRLRGAERARMLRWRARLEPEPEVMSPAGERWGLPSAQALQALQRDIAESGAELAWEHSPGQPLVDVRPVSIISKATLRSLAAELGTGFDPRRLRTNLVLALFDDQPFAEEALAGCVLRFGDMEATGLSLAVRERVPRCGVVSVDVDSGGVDRSLLRWLARNRQGRVAIYATVASPGVLRVGDAVWLEQEPFLARPR